MATYGGGTTVSTTKGFNDVPVNTQVALYTVAPGEYVEFTALSATSLPGNIFPAQATFQVQSDDGNGGWINAANFSSSAVADSDLVNNLSGTPAKGPLKIYHGQRVIAQTAPGPAGTGGTTKNTRFSFSVTHFTAST